MRQKRHRRTRSHACATTLWVALACALLPLAACLFTLLRLGLPGLNSDFLFTAMRRGGTEGGVSGQITGTLILMATTLLVSLPGAMGAALWIAGPFALPPRLRRPAENLLHSANAMPSLLLGLFGMIVFSRMLGLGKSWLVGGLTLGMMVLPSVALSIVQRFRAIAPAQQQAACGLGLGPMRQVTALYLPQALGGIVTGLVLGLARAAGETAPILFTASVFSGAGFPQGLRDSPVLALPYHIFVLAQDVSHAGAQQRVWSAALVLLLLVWFLALLVFPLRLRQNTILQHR